MTRGVAWVCAISAMFCGSICCSATSPNPEVSFEPSEVELRGLLAGQTWWGPPGFGEDPGHDSKEQGIVLRLSTPIEVRGRPEDPRNGVSVRDLSKIQLIGEPLVHLTKALPKGLVVVRGTLFTGHSGHHHTKVVMMVLELVEAPSGPNLPD